MRIILKFALCAIIALSFSACGKAGSKKGKAKAAPQMIYISSGDCADGTIITPEQCEQVVDLAINKHSKKSKIYPSLRKCEKSEGADRCERGLGDEYRPRLAAFLVTGGDKPGAEPLYPSKDPKKPGFVRLSGKAIVESALKIAFSDRAVAAAERN